MKTSVLMLSAVMGLNGLAAFGQGYPSRPIRAVIPYAPGGVSDLVLRSLSDPLAQRLGQPIVIENRGGGGGTVAAGQVARAAADGHLVMLGTGGNLAMAPSLYKSLSYDPQKDFAPIAMVARGQLVLVVHPSVPASSVRELVNLARTRPGQLNYASSGVGSPLHLAMELFKSLTHTEIVHVPYKGSAPMLADLAGGQVDIGFDSIATSLPHMQSGRLKGVAVSGEARSLAAPDLHTMAEAGVPAPRRRERALQLLEYVGLRHREGHRATQLSGGEMQRVAIARALANPPAVLLADEPTGEVDAATGREILDLFRRLNRDGTTLLVVTHDERLAAEAGRLVHMLDGRIVADGGSRQP